MQNILKYGIALSLLSMTGACQLVSEKPTDITGQTGMTERSNTFAKLTEAAIEQLLRGTPGPIPQALLDETERTLEAATFGKPLGEAFPSMDKMFVLENSEVVRLDDIGTSKSGTMKGLLILGAPLSHKTFDWTLMFLVDLDRWELLDVSVNTQFGQKPRNRNPDSGSFLLMNDMRARFDRASNRGDFASRYLWKRVFVPQTDGEALSLKHPDKTLWMYLPNEDPQKQYVLDTQLDVYALSSQKLSAQSQPLGSWIKVGALR
ncbi:MAG: hypothetical protein U0Z75_05650 [Deinococcaceae bacterium]